MIGGGLGLPLRVPSDHGRNAHARLAADQWPVEYPTGKAIPDDPYSKLAGQGINLLTWHRSRR